MRRYLPVCGIAHHGTVAVVHLRFFAGRGFNHHASFRRRDSAQLANEPLDAVVSPGEAVVVHQVLPDGHGVAATRQPQFDDFPVRLARAGSRTAARLPFRLGHRGIGWLFRRRVGGHLYGRFCRRSPAPTARWPERDPGRFEVSAGRFPPDTGGLLNPPQRPAEPAQGNHLLFLFFAQDIAHVDGAYIPRQGQCPGSAISLAGFQVATYGRFWVATEANSPSWLRTKRSRRASRRSHFLSKVRSGLTVALRSQV